MFPIRNSLNRASVEKMVPTCSILIVLALEVLDEQVAWYNDGAVAQQVDKEPRDPGIMHTGPVQLLSCRRRRVGHGAGNRQTSKAAVNTIQNRKL